MIQHASPCERCERGRRDWKGSARGNLEKDTVEMRSVWYTTQSVFPRDIERRMNEWASERTTALKSENCITNILLTEDQKGAVKGDFSLVIHGRCIMSVRGKGNIPLRKWAERHVKLRLFRAAVQRLHPWIHFFPLLSLSHHPHVRHCGDRSLAWTHIFN